MCYYMTKRHREAWTSVITNMTMEMYDLKQFPSQSLEGMMVFVISRDTCKTVLQVQQTEARLCAMGTRRHIFPLIRKLNRRQTRLSLHEGCRFHEENVICPIANEVVREPRFEWNNALEVLDMLGCERDPESI